MIKMMVVEDETILREGICRVGNWPSHGVEICGKAGNGREAITQIGQCRPDVILTDVVMPVMNGIDLAKWVHEKYPEIRLIFLSGHEEFEYVKQAMEYKACSYLLKPARIEKIVEVVTGIRDEILRERERVLEEERLQKKLEQSIPILQNHYMNQLLSGAELEEEIIRRQFEYLQINLKCRNIAVLVCETDAAEEEGNASSLLRLRLGEICQEVIGSEYPCVIFTDLRDRIVAVLNYPGDVGKKDMLLYIQGKAVRIQKEMERSFGESISLGIGRLASHITNLPQAYKEAEHALSYRFFMGKGSVIYIGDIEKEEYRGASQLEQKEGELLSCIKAGDVAGMTRQMEEYFGLLGQYSRQGQIFVYEEITVFISSLLRSLRGRNSEGEENLLREAEGLLEELRENRDRSTLSELQCRVYQTLQSITETINSSRILRNEGIIEKAKKYVRQNLSGDVSLITVAEAVYVSPNYLSCLFKESGENFKDYVIRVKMQAAEEMMESKKYSMSQIAAALGYRDGRYFSQVYKKFKESQTP